MAIEEPEYKIELKKENYEIRAYGPIVVAETKIESDFENAGNQAFRILAAYIFGAVYDASRIHLSHLTFAQRFECALARNRRSQNSRVFVFGLVV